MAPGNPVTAREPLDYRARMPFPAGDSPFDALVAELVADQLRANPVLASGLGVTEHDSELPDLSTDGIAARERAEDDWVRRLRAVDEGGLTDDELIDRDLALMVLRGRELQRDWADWRRTPDPYAGAALSGVFGLLQNRLRPDGELAEAVAARLRATPDLLAQGRVNLDPSLASPVLLRRSLGQIGAGAAYSRSVSAEFAGDRTAAALVAEAGEAAAAAFEELGAHVESMVERATGDWAIGEDRYSALLREAEGLSYGARELHEKGRALYDELAADMRARSQELRGTDDFLEVLRGCNDDHPETPEEMLALYQEATDAARGFCAEHDLVTMPDGESCVVAPSAPFTRSMIAVAHYMQPPPFAPAPAGAGGRPGHFFVPYPPDGSSPEQVAERLATNNRHGAWSIAVQEAYPGHHWQFAWLAAQSAAGRARPLRFVFGSTYFVEGWGLYAEDLLREQGFFRTPEQELAQRDYRLFRAARIIVDTALHMGDMTVEEGVDFMATKSSLSRDTARAEVLRYCAWPTQASSYLTGAVEIARMRDRWLTEARGPLKEFHDRAAGSGRLPIGLVERALFA
jgi:uncharacterized protein (DUF885 family)